MKYSENIFCSRPSIALSILSIILAFLFNITTTTNSFSKAGFEQQLTQKSKDALELISATEQRSSISPFVGQNIPHTFDNHSRSGSGSSVPPKSYTSDIGIEAKNTNNWITVNHDIYGTRFSNQIIINKDNVAKLQIKWRLSNDVEIQDPPIVAGNDGYVQDYAGTVIAFDTGTGKVLWKAKAGIGPTMGLTFNKGIVYAVTASNATVVAINSTDGKIIWQSQTLGNPKTTYNIPTFPILWKGYLIVGSAAGNDLPDGLEPIRGNITALNTTNGKIIWNLHTTIGKWVNPHTAPAYNGGANDWSGGSLDPETGIIYMPLGSPSPNYNANTRQTGDLYSNHMIAINVTNGRIIWATPFVARGTVLNVKVPDTHDWDTSWGSSISKVTFDNGTQKKIVVGHDKMGNIMAMDATTGKEIWWKILGKQYNTDAIPTPNGTGMIWSYGIFNYHAVDNNNTLYIAATNRGLNYFTDGAAVGHRIAAPHTIQLGMRNGTIAAMDLRTGKVKWQYPTEFPTTVSPLVTNDLVFAGYIPFTEKIKGNHTSTSRSGVILALDKETGKKMWEYNVNAQIGQVGPSIGNGLLFVPTGKIQTQPKNTPRVGGSIVAFGIP
jgi:outer membrane protein assembly factor BamB